MSYPKQAGFSPPIVDPSAPPCEQPVIVQQVFVVQQPGAQPVYVGDNIVKTDQPPPYSQHPLVQQPLVPKPALEQPQQPVPAVQGRRKRQKNENGDPEGTKDCCQCYYCVGDTLLCLLCCPFYVLKCIFE